MRLAQSFFNGLRDLGYVQNRDFDIVSRLAASTSDLDKAAEELVRLNPDVIFAGASANALALKKATSTIPIVVAALGNTVALGLNARDTRRPTGNVTGIMPYVEGLPSKQLELAREIIPGAQKIGIVNDTSDAKAGPQWEEINATVTRFDIKIAGADAHTTEAIEPAFARFRSDRVDVVVILQSNFLMFDRAQIGTAALAHRLPTVAGYRELVEAGALISYGVNLDSCHASIVPRRTSTGSCAARLSRTSRSSSRRGWSSSST